MSPAGIAGNGGAATTTAGATGDASGTTSVVSTHAPFSCSVRADSNSAITASKTMPQR